MPVSGFRSSIPADVGRTPMAHGPPIGIRAVVERSIGTIRSASMAPRHHGLLIANIALPSPNLHGPGRIRSPQCAWTDRATEVLGAIENHRRAAFHTLPLERSCCGEITQRPMVEPLRRVTRVIRRPEIDKQFAGDINGLQIRCSAEESGNGQETMGFFHGYQGFKKIRISADQQAWQRKKDRQLPFSGKLADMSILYRLFVWRNPEPRVNGA